MTYSGLTHQIRQSRQRSSRQGAAVDMFIFHGQASTNDDATIALMTSGRKEVSANYTISNEGRITGIVDEEDRAWTSGSSTDGGKGAAYDRRAITVEIENQTGAPGWTFSHEAHEAAAQLLADASRRHGIPLDRDHCVGHRELFTRWGASYATSCPQALDMDWIVARARAIRGLGGAITPALGGGVPSPEGDYAFGLTNAAVLSLQKGLARLGRYKGDQDGVAGPMTVRALQAFLKDEGLLGADYDVDGQPGPVYGEALQRLAQRAGYDGPIDGDPGENTSAALVKIGDGMAPNVPQTHDAPQGSSWSYWEPTGALAERVQRALAGMGRYSGPIDGEFGENTRKGVQETLRVSGAFVGLVDGVIGEGGSRGIQVYAQRFGDYTGPIDGAPREASWTGFALGLERK